MVQRQSSERGLGGVSVILEGRDLNGTEVRMEMETDLHGEFRFERIAPGDYTVTEVQPEFVLDGQAMLGSTAVPHDALSFSVGESADYRRRQRVWRGRGFHRAMPCSTHCLPLGRTDFLSSCGERSWPG